MGRARCFWYAQGVIVEADYWVAFSVFPGIGPVRFRLLREYFGSAKSAWLATSTDLKKTGLGDKLVSSFEIFRREFVISAYQQKLKDMHVTPLPLDDPRYPTLLAEISDAPIVLYVLGRRTDVPINMKRTVAIVGTRKITKYGIEVTKSIANELVHAGITIVSGLAYGVDAVAHQEVIDAGGKTIAVLGCGIDIIAPSSNASLYHAIQDGAGAIVSEMPLGLRPTKGLFPARNRIISGLSLGVVVTEGADDSGALITARYALDQGREVFAVPGPVTSVYSKGPFKLIKDGATIVENGADIIEALGLHTSQKVVHNRYIGQTKEEQKILEILSDRRVSIDELVRLTNLTVQVVASILTSLELREIVKDFGEKEYGMR